MPKLEVPTAAHEASARLLQRPLISDVGQAAYSVLPDGRVEVHDFFKPPPQGHRRIQANGVGQFCRWMLTDEALIIARPDRSFITKPRPPELPYTTGYRNVFSFRTPHSDMLVLSGDANTYVVSVHASGIDEHTLALGVRCFAGHGPDARYYTLLGQTPRAAEDAPVATGGDAPGSAISVSVTDTGFRAQHVQTPPPLVLESIVAALPAGRGTLLIGAQQPAPRQMEDFEASPNPIPADHDVWWAMPCQDGVPSGPMTAIRDACFVACAGGLGQERVYFQLAAAHPQAEGQAVLLSIDASGHQALHPVANLPLLSTISHLQFDPLVQWLGIARGHTTQQRFVLGSRDGLAWSALAVAP
jgi:hypothetical protein